MTRRQKVATLLRLLVEQQTLSEVSPEIAELLGHPYPMSKWATKQELAWDAVMPLAELLCPEEDDDAK